MALTVENGTGLPGADAFISVEYFEAYCAARGHSLSTSTDTLKEQAIVRASAFLSDSYSWAGWIVSGRGSNGGKQGLAWPRSGVVDDEGYAIPSDEVPDEVQRATAEITRRELVTPGAMTPDYTPSTRVKSEKVGALAVEYDLSRVDAESVRPVLLVVRDLIGPLLDQTGGSRLSGEAVRA